MDIMFVIELIIYAMAGIAFYKCQQNNREAEWKYIWLLYINIMITIICNIVY